MKKKIGRILHWVYIGGVYVLGLLIMSELNWPAFVYPLWTLIYAAGYIAHDLEHGEWPGDNEERK